MEEHPEARHIVETLARAGFTAYYAGGWVRDFLLKHPSDDIDIATDAPPGAIQKLFPRTVPIGLAFGIILVLVNQRQYEVATFRTDFDYRDGRRPERIAFSSPEEDAKRRDFTINGLFYNPLSGEILDYVGGRQDLERGVIRAIGNPHDRIREDRLRMIRAIRLSCRFSFPIEEETANAIKAHAKELFPAVAIERIVQEFEKGRAFKALHPMLLLLHEFDLLAAIFPEIGHRENSELQGQLAPLERYPADTPLIAFLLPLFPNASPEERLQLAKRLKLPNAEVSFALYLHRLEQAVFGPAEPEKAVWAHLYANQLFPLAIRIAAARLSPEEGRKLLEEHDRRLLSLGEAVRRIQCKDPVVKSGDLDRAGIPPGPAMGALLKEAEKISANEELYERNAVIERLRQSGKWTGHS